MTENEGLETLNDGRSNKPIYITQDVFTVINMCKRGDVIYRIFMDNTTEGEKYYLVDASSNITHGDMMRIVIDNGYVATNSYNNGMDEQYVVFIPRGMSTSTYKYRTSLGEDSYISERVFDYGEFFVRDIGAYDYDLFRYLRGCIRTITIHDDGEIRNDTNVFSYKGTTNTVEFITTYMVFTDEITKEDIFKEDMSYFGTVKEYDGVYYSLEEDRYSVNGVDRSKWYDIIEIKDNIDGYDVTTIKSYSLADLNCHDITLPNTIKYINSYAFSRSDIHNLVIPSSVEGINGFAFYNCRNLNSVTFPDTDVSVGRGAFNGCDSLKKVNLGAISFIPMEMFYGCSELKEIYIPDSVTDIGDSAFTRCSKLENIRMSSNVDYLEYNVFHYDFNIKSITNVSDRLYSSLPDELREYVKRDESDFDYND